MSLSHQEKMSNDKNRERVQAAFRNRLIIKLQIKDQFAEPREKE